MTERTDTELFEARFADRVHAYAEVATTRPFDASAATRAAMSSAQPSVGGGVWLAFGAVRVSVARGLPAWPSPSSWSGSSRSASSGSRHTP